MLIEKEQMEGDNLFPKQRCLTVFLKRRPEELHSSFFSFVKDPDCNEQLYETNFYKDIDTVMKQVAAHYTEDLSKLVFSLPSQISESKWSIHIIFSIPMHNTFVHKLDL